MVSAKSWRWCGAFIAVLALLASSTLAADIAVGPAKGPRPRDSVLARSPQPSHDDTTGIPVGSPTHAPVVTDEARRHGWTSAVASRAASGVKVKMHAENNNVRALGLTGHTVR